VFNGAEGVVAANQATLDAQIVHGQPQRVPDPPEATDFAD